MRPSPSTDPPPDRALGRLATGALPGALLRLAGPSTVALVTTALYNMVDAFWVARLGATAMGALTLSFPYLMGLSAVGSGLGLGLTSVAARHLGADDTTGARRVAGQLLPLSLAVGLLFALPVLLAPDRVLALLGATSATMGPGRAYLVLVGLASPFVAFTALASNLLRGAGDTTRPMVVMMAGAILNAVLDPLLIFGAGPVPAMGVPGAALATALSQALSALACALLLLRAAPAYAWHPTRSRPHGPSLRAVAAVGVPSVVVPALLAAVILVQNRMIAPWGEAALGAFGILFRLSTLLVMPVFGLCQGLLPLLAFAWGRRDAARFREALAWAAGLALGMGLVWGGLLGGGAATVVRAFDPGPELGRVTAAALPIFVLGFPFLGPQLVLMTAAQGRDRAPRALAFVLGKSFLLLLPLFHVLPRHMGLAGFWWAQALAEMAGCLLALPWLGKVPVLSRQGEEEEVPRL